MLHLIVCNTVSSYSGGLGTPVSHDHTQLSRAAIKVHYGAVLVGYLVFFDKSRAFYCDLTLHLSSNSS